MDRIKEKINSLTVKLDTATTENEELKETVKKLQAEQLENENEIAALKTRLEKAEPALDAETTEQEKRIQELTEKLSVSSNERDCFERKVRALEEDRDNWEKKYDEMVMKYKEVKTELDEFSRGLEHI
ncbi:tropomyosin like domain-containing protein [Pochonia chlamydosporia 170]|uniref:Tropomyosin like domain-containing protein n=1 Tax=Pochonia chlamydosporia 170 TaxID=1380566 RepID=A0A179G4G7_METCM|nr:tropomyosin like domain-containing protein [Pochonia chlamydosporia 170]OAQ72725.1 tropomyosin like domain-containing protein [Pochonia chlamydosporia 170]